MSQENKEKILSSIRSKVKQIVKILAEEQRLKQQNCPQICNLLLTLYPELKDDLEKALKDDLKKAWNTCGCKEIKNNNTISKTVSSDQKLKETLEKLKQIVRHMTGEPNAD